MPEMGNSGSSNSSPEHIIFDFERDISVQKTQRFRHPTAALFHVAFKMCAVIVYLFGGLFGQGFLGTFVSLILLISMDFWTVKNVTGRLLVGLRWWNIVDEDGNSRWVFENKYATDGDKNSFNLMENTPPANTSDAQLFWSALILTPLLWFFLLLVTIFRLNVQWFMVVALALVLSGSNLYGYIRCKVGTRDIKSTLTQFVGKQIFYKYLSSNTSNNKTPAHNNQSFPTA
ncbi:putative Golgi apparatus membrane-like protein isoform X2 [Leptotrombidium deliense]|uniref:Golgi apparatus membrane protein TVP23 homolog n=1 Tax=Leptotrombidium deliense TaxID=299467 RepID=A0A443SEH7_9ACAR|nr:putative Golgi apparatus membrane-like protein isoform X2 [Leptotrombidium deliense]